MSYRIDVVRDAAAEIKALPRRVRALAVELAAALAANPRPARARELSARPNVYRIWLAGHWRVAYQVDDEGGCVFVLHVRQRQEIAFDTLPPWMREGASWGESPEAGYADAKRRGDDR